MLQRTENTRASMYMKESLQVKGLEIFNIVLPQKS